ncbi:MAG: hypothetical protein H7096_11485 [Flavobacterium sp.]|nr:hypothetical protein [Pedobacter sp.]
MKFQLLIYLSLITLSAFAMSDFPADPSKIKKAMLRAIENPRITDSLYSELKLIKSPAPVVVAYLGTLEALKAKYSWNPYNKIAYVARSQKTLEKAVKEDPLNLEIRFMRFSVQHYTPAFLGFSKELIEDRKMIIKQYAQKNFGKLDNETLKNIAEFLIFSKRCSSPEIKILKKYS